MKASWSYRSPAPTPSTRSRKRPSSANPAAPAANSCSSCDRPASLMKRDHLDEERGQPALPPQLAVPRTPCPARSPATATCTTSRPDRAGPPDRDPGRDRRTRYPPGQREEPRQLVPADLREPSQALQFLAREHLRRHERPPQLRQIRRSEAYSAISARFSASTAGIPDSGSTRTIPERMGLGMPTQRVTGGPLAVRVGVHVGSGRATTSWTKGMSHVASFAGFL